MRKSRLLSEEREGPEANAAGLEEKFGAAIGGKTVTGVVGSGWPVLSGAGAGGPPSRGSPVVVGVLLK